MPLVRITTAVPLEGRRVKLTLTDGREVERDLSNLLVGPIFEQVREDRAMFERVQVEQGALAWPNGADLCPDMVIWNGPPPPDNAAIGSVPSDADADAPARN